MRGASTMFKGLSFCLKLSNVHKTAKDASSAVFLQGFRSNGSSVREEDEGKRVAAKLEVASTANLRKYYQMTSEAQRALLDYLHVSRGVDFSDAEHMSNNSPMFIRRLLKEVEGDRNIYKALSRFFQFSPINEFEPFFESIGVMPAHLDEFVPANSIFLKDNTRLYENYRLLYDYGIARNKIGKIYRKATEAFSYDTSVLKSRFKALEDLDLSRHAVVKLVISCPELLTGEPYDAFVEVRRRLDSIGIPCEWIVVSLSCDESTYNWCRVLKVLQLFDDLGFASFPLGELIRRHPDFILGRCGERVLLVVGFLVKRGARKDLLHKIFNNLSNMHVAKFAENLLEAIKFLDRSEMSCDLTREILAARSVLFGSEELNTHKKC